ncbi:MAG: helix-turn-helix transcriptional regulator [Bryobacterales bacterium]|nr:helix-turn-helix transcriptional regulator [Bryobacterales bacterium]
MVRGYQTFKEFQQSGENIATNILSDRLQKLEAAGILTAKPAPEDLRRIHYRLTEKGVALAPVIYELLIWAGRHGKTGAPCAVIEHMARNREHVLAEVRRRWEQQDLTPILPTFKKEKHK